MYSYDRRHLVAAQWDQSVLSITPSELAEMHPDERAEELEAALHRAGDLAEAIGKAFKKDLVNDYDDVVHAAKLLQGVARKFADKR